MLYGIHIVKAGKLPRAKRMEIDKAQLEKQLLAWWDAGHLSWPWRESQDPYVIWVAEVMLQQTQIATVIPYFERWMARFPTVQDLAAASLDEVLKLWEGLGYYSRARNLHAAAKIVVAEHAGHLPETVPELLSLPGIGRYTAGAIASIAFNQAVPVLDGNVMRVLSRLIDLPEDVTQSATKRKLWQLAGSLVPDQRPGEYNEAFMELGQQVCLPSTPDCHLCPLADQCQAFERGTVDQRPVKPARKPTPHYDVVAGIIWKSGEPAATKPFLIARRPLDGLLGGLWEFPGGKIEKGESHAQALRREIEEELALKIIVGQPLTIVKHAYTHFRITLHAYHATANGAHEAQDIGVAGHAWVTIDDLDQYAFATADRQIIAALKTQLVDD
jgi:A/G-specific adenine glycosylase